MTLDSLLAWRRLGYALVLGTAIVPTACVRVKHADLKPLDDAGFSYSSLQQIEQLDPTKEEVAELVKTSQGGVSEAACVQLLQVARGQKRHFAEGEAVAGLHAASLADATILELARLRQIESWWGEAQAIRLTGISDRVILAVAQRRAAGQAVPSGVSLAHLKDAGVSEATLVELLNRGMTDSDAESVVWRKKQHWTDEQILRDYPAKS